jgi:hypothetical protein
MRIVGLGAVVMLQDLNFTDKIDTRNFKFKSIGSGIDILENGDIGYRSSSQNVRGIPLFFVCLC